MTQVLFDLHMQVLRRKQLMTQLESLKEQENELRVKESQLAMQMQEEQQDVVRLEGRSLARLFHAVAGNLWNGKHAL